MEPGEILLLFALTLTPLVVAFVFVAALWVKKLRRRDGTTWVGPWITVGTCFLTVHLVVATMQAYDHPFADSQMYRKMYFAGITCCWLALVMAFIGRGTCRKLLLVASLVCGSTWTLLRL